jgi:Protein of unknown function (DUF2812)
MSVTTRWRYFLAYEDPKAEAWLEEHARHGLHLTRPGLFRFAFEEGEPRTEKYRLDFQTLRGSSRDEYLALFRDAGWEFVGQVANRYYFRAQPDAIAPEIFSDVESRRDRIRRQMRFGAVVTGLLALETSIGLNRLFKTMAGQVAGASIGAPILMVALTGSFSALGVWVIWQLEQAYKRQH